VQGESVLHFTADTSSWVFNLFSIRDVIRSSEKCTEEVLQTFELFADRTSDPTGYSCTTVILFGQSNPRQCDFLGSSTILFPAYLPFRSQGASSPVFIVYLRDRFVLRQEARSSSVGMLTYETPATSILSGQSYSIHTGLPEDLVRCSESSGCNVIHVPLFSES
jgi:hypothetical protein